MHNCKRNLLQRRTRLARRQTVIQINRGAGFGKVRPIAVFSCEYSHYTTYQEVCERMESGTHGSFRTTFRTLSSR